MLKFGMVLCALLLVACGSDGSNTANADVDDDVLLVTVAPIRRFKSVHRFGWRRT